MNYSLLVEEAIKAKDHAYVPYSNFRVGAALLTKEGQIFTGCNIENAAYSPTNCAERTAVFKAVSEGYTDFKAIAIAGDTKDVLTPCGVCRQVLMEFCSQSNLEVLLVNHRGEYEIMKLKELLPAAFGDKSLNDT